MRKKILIIGSPGAGKSTLAKQLHDKLNLPLIHLDKLYYKQNWERPDKTEWIEQVINLCKEESWIIDGNYITTLEVRASYADLIIWLDTNRWICLYRALSRILLLSKRKRFDMAKGCPPKFDHAHLLSIIKFPISSKPQIENILSGLIDKEVLVLKNKQSVEALLENLL